MPVATERLLGSLVNEDSARLVFLAWEKLRILFNVGLVWVTLTLLPNWSWRSIPWRDYIGPAILANVCFCAGPCAEGYLTWLGANRQLARWMLFVVGFLFACCLVPLSFIDFGP